jgi:hypothetical protein
MNRVATIFVLLLVPVLAFAQLPFSIGGKFGINLANASLDPSLPSQISKSGKTGFAFGGVVELGVGGPVYVQIEPMYIQKGVKLEGPLFQNNLGQVLNGTITNKVTFLEFPILAKAKFPAGPVKPYGFLGPALGIRLSAKEEDEVPSAGYKEETSQDSTTSSIDFSLAFGGGAEFTVAPKVAVTADVRYVLGLKDLNTSADQPGQQHRSIKTNGIQFFVGVLFKVGK